MSEWSLIAVPGTILVLFGVLMLSAAVERWLLSPPSLIAGAVRARRTSPDQAERLVAREAERLLRPTV